MSTPLPTKGSIGDAGTLVISLDFELSWGVRDVLDARSSYNANIRGARAAVPAILDLFEKYGVAATWATVGFLFAKNHDELVAHMPPPEERPIYENPRLDPYAERLGRNEQDDPLHYAGSLVERIARTPRQEVGSHTFSHYFCLEPGQNRRAFEADLRAARSIANARRLEVSSLVLPRNQLNVEYRDAIAAAGFTAFRGNPKHWAYAGARESEQHLARRALRFVDALVPVAGSHLTDASTLDTSSGLVDVPASLFLRVFPTSARFMRDAGIRRITIAMKRAAMTGRILHLWWHPHNFGVSLDARLHDLELVLEMYRRCAAEFGMQSLSMGEVATRALAARHEANPNTLRHASHHRENGAPK